MHHIRLFILCSLLLSVLLPCRGEAADLYSVIYSDASTYNGNEAQCDWITNAILYASASYNVDPLLITAGDGIQLLYGGGQSCRCDRSHAAYACYGGRNWRESICPLGNILGGTIYLRIQLDNFGGLGAYGVTTAVAAYNAGSAAIYQYGGIPPYRETLDYVDKVHRAYMNLYQMYQYG